METEQSRCTECGKVRDPSQLNGRNPMAAPGQQFTRAYCKNLMDCDSPRCADIIKQLQEAMKSE